MKFAERPLQRVFAEENEFGEAFLLDGSDPPFGEGVQIRAAGWKAQTADAIGGQHVVKRGATLRISVM